MSFAPPGPEPVTIAGPSGMLEGIVETPSDVRAIAVVCHPHPLHGGTMTNKVVQTVARAFNECGAATVRFNYRGVGHSSGVYDEGIGETQDALAVIAWAQDRWPDKELWLAGFSFGGGVALRAAVQTAAVRLVTVSPAAARTAPPEQLPTCPWLLLQGDADDLIPAPMVLDWVQSLSTKPEVKILPGASHFFHGRLAELRQLIRTWIGD